MNQHLTLADHFVNKTAKTGIVPRPTNAVVCQGMPTERTVRVCQFVSLHASMVNVWFQANVNVMMVTS